MGELRKTTRLKQMLLSPEILVMPGVYDVLSAKMAEHCGIKAVQVTGYGMAASYLGLPDVAILTKTQMLEITRNICTATTIPVMADGDTGFGNAINLYYAIKDFEAAGAAGINIEDQFFPKRCGHMSGKQIIPFNEAVKKIEAAAAARTDPDFVINARTDAIAVAGVDEAIRRGNAFAAAGADMIFVEAPRREDDIKRVIQSINAPVSINMVYSGKTPAVSFDKLQEWGAARVSVPIAALFAVTKTLERTYRAIVTGGRELEDVCNDSYQFSQFTDFIGLPFIKELEQKYISSDELSARYDREE